jgi:hypothetical protein
MSAPFDAWVSDFEDVADVPSPTTSGSFSDLGRTSSSSLDHAGAGSGGGVPDGEYEGGAKRSHLFLFDSSLAADCKLCLGFVGTGGRRFCLRPIIGTDSKGIWTCGIAKHSSKFKPVPGSFYLRGNDTCAHTVPALPSTFVPPGRLADILASKHTIAEWTNIFTELTNAPLDSSSGVRGLNLDPDITVSLKTPANPPSTYDPSTGFMFFSPSGLNLILNQVSDDEGRPSWLSNPPASIPSDLLGFLRGVRSFLMDYEQWWKTPLADTYEATTMIKDDLYTLKQSCEKIQWLIGKPVTIYDMDFPDLWSGLEYVCTKQLPQQDLSNILDELSALKLAWDDLPTILDQFATQNDLGEIKDTLARFEHRFTVIGPLLRQIKTLATEVKSLTTQHASLPQSRGPTMLNRPGSFRPPSPVLLPATDDNLARISTLELKLTNLENRVVGEGVTIGT